MSKIKYDKTQVVNILKEVEDGIKIKDICKKYNITSKTLSELRQRYSDISESDILLGVSDLKILEQENRWLKLIVAEQLLELKEISKKFEEQFKSGAKFKISQKK